MWDFEKPQKLVTVKATWVTFSTDMYLPELLIMNTVLNI